MTRFLTILAAAWLCAAAPARAELKVVATLSDLAGVAEAVGGDDVSVTLLCPGANDPHYLPAKPSLARKLGKADLLIYNGLELEVGWLPQLIQKARNKKVRPGARGELDCSGFLHHVLDVPTGHVDRGHGDVHPLGNPHYHLDPHLMMHVAEGVAERMAELDPGRADAYRERAAAFAARLEAEMPRWEAEIAPLRDKNILIYHRHWTYLVEWLGLDVYGEIEHRPGIAPSPKHVQNVIERGRNLGDVVVVAATWDHLDVAKRAAERIGAELVVLPGATGAVEGADDYVAFLDTIIGRLAAAAEGR